MKNSIKIFAIALLFISVFCINGNAQNLTQDVVYLKNGSIIRGFIVEQIVGESIKIQSADGNIFVYKLDEILKMTKEAPIGKSIAPSSDVKFTGNQKSPFLSGACSFLIPGLGQIVNGDYITGLGFFVGTYGLIYGGSALVYDSPEVGGVMALLGVGTYIWSIVDAAVGANRYNKRQSLLSLEFGKESLLKLNPDVQLNRDMSFVTGQSISPSYGLKLSLGF